MKKITKAVIPAAGLGTRVLPLTKAMPKEMIPIVDKPAIQFIVEEAVKSGITDILIITGRNKHLIEDHFDRAPELEAKLLESNRQEAYEDIVEISKLANISYIRQKETKGLGHAVYQAKSFVGDDPFVVMYGDDVILGDNPVCAQLMKTYEKYGKPSVGVKEVSLDLVMKYCTLKVDNIEDNIYMCTDMIEKPSKDKIFSHFSILGRCLLTPDIFNILEETPPGAGGEIQLTDAMCTLARKNGIIAVDFEGTRYDMGNKLGILKATVETALTHKEVGEEFKAYLKEISKTL